MIVAVLHETDEGVLRVSLVHLMPFEGMEDAFRGFLEGVENLEHGPPRSDSYCIRESM
jgi:hypothetical protein